MASVSERRARILQFVQQQGYAANEDLAKALNVTVQTVRRDVNSMAADGIIARHHGGASAISAAENIAYSDRQILNLKQKEAIGQGAATAIPDGASLFINIGTTTEAFARSLRTHRALRVITNNIHVATLLAPAPDCNLVITGGTVRLRDGGIVGPAAAAMIEQYRADFGVIGISGIDEDGTLLDFDVDEIAAAQAIIRNARTVFLLADHTKFKRRPMARVGHISEISAFFTDQQPPAAIKAILQKAGVALHVIET
ncbi:glycerol-3-phosphate regulon repressor [Acetobacter indonesiensis NRIC 0313]|uniref:DeoR family transcriptional regulator n=1 Tax=Acetobacter indonesiensis TaxID=104101 RepID=A0A252AUQ8_9PROT|nr:DeoR/GlpR family DNA-binding transcription regulator [Acetobacter indonesiensis]OUI94203.1 DeoR family transcriptional regulator [Acetobacter indonesiensis]GAN63948.1 transcriptional repressor DeoR, ascorbate regulon/glycerol-3-phosphate regulon [Acetobacter indonesiensis]GBQ59921.1 glycerol-3-phosphate regulon repressor [Acetobacter indonesiensis NRIC 0313]GEN02765.1 DeoR/GlpR family transcriptional regulator [Acetobacter indonesiensis]